MMVARTVVVRVTGSTRASTATIRAAMGVESVVVTTWTGVPARRPTATCCDTAKSTCTAPSMPWSVVSCVPSFRYWPGCTSEMPTRAHERPVRSGPMLGDEIVILDGLTAGERVAASGSFKLREGVLVAVDAPKAGGAQQ